MIHFTGWVYADPLVSVLIGLFIVYSSWGIVRETVNVLLEGAPRDLDIGDMAQAMQAVPGVTDVHDLHVWTIGDGMNALSCHLRVTVKPTCPAPPSWSAPSRTCLPPITTCATPPLKRSAATAKARDLYCQMSKGGLRAFSQPRTFGSLPALGKRYQHASMSALLLTHKPLPLSPRHRSPTPTAGLRSVGRWLVPLLLLLLAIPFLYRAPYSASSLEIVPDSVEYAVGAQRIALLGRYDIAINHVAYPPRYAPWFSTDSLADLSWLTRGEMGSGILVVFAFALGGVLALYAVGCRLGAEWSGPESRVGREPERFCACCLSKNTALWPAM